MCTLCPLCIPFVPFEVKPYNLLTLEGNKFLLPLQFIGTEDLSKYGS